MSTIEEIRALALSLQGEAKFLNRVEEWRRGSLPSGAGSERVGGSRSAKLPAFDRLDRALNQAEQSYRQSVDVWVDAMSVGDHRTAIRALLVLVGLEQTWLYEKEIAPEDLAELVSDEPACVKCHRTKEQWVAAGYKTKWRRKRALCLRCYEAWRAEGCPLDVYPDKLEELDRRWPLAQSVPPVRGPARAEVDSAVHQGARGQAVGDRSCLRTDALRHLEVVLDNLA